MWFSSTCQLLEHCLCYVPPSPFTFQLSWPWSGSSSRFLPLPGNLFLLFLTQIISAHSLDPSWNTHPQNKLPGIPEKVRSCRLTETITVCENCFCQYLIHIYFYSLTTKLQNSWRQGQHLSYSPFYPQNQCLPYTVFTLCMCWMSEFIDLMGSILWKILVVHLKKKLISFFSFSGHHNKFR